MRKAKMVSIYIFVVVVVVKKKAIKNLTSSQRKCKIWRAGQAVGFRAQGIMKIGFNSVKKKKVQKYSIYK